MLIACQHLRLYDTCTLSEVPKLLFTVQTKPVTRLVSSKQESNVSGNFFDLLSKFKKRKFLIPVIIFSVNEKKKNLTFIYYYFFERGGGGLLHCEAYKKKYILIKLFNSTTPVLRIKFSGPLRIWDTVLVDVHHSHSPFHTNNWDWQCIYIQVQIFIFCHKYILSVSHIAQPPQISILSPLMYFFIFMYIVFHFELCVLILTQI